MKRKGDCITLEGPLNLQTIPETLRYGLEQLADGASVVDFAAVTEVDSASVAMVIEWVRATSAKISNPPAKALRFINLPAGFVSLCRLYGVTELLPVG